MRRLEDSLFQIICDDMSWDHLGRPSEPVLYWVQLSATSLGWKMLSQYLLTYNK